MSEQVFLTPSEAATLLGVDRSTIWRWARTKKLPAAAVAGRGALFTRADVEQFAEKHGLELTDSTGSEAESNAVGAASATSIA